MSQLPFPGTRTCILCDSFDEHGLQDHMSLEDGRLVLEFVPAARLQGFHGIMHGGFIAAFMDEVIGVAVGFGNGGVAATHQLKLDYLKPVHIGEWLRFEGWIGGHVSGHLHWGEGRVLNSHGTVLVTGRGEFAVMQQKVLDRIFRRRS